MNIDFHPLLQVQRDIYRLPRGMSRFRQYLRTMLNEDGDDLLHPPLVLMNPMARDHVTALLDELLTLKADEVAARALADASARLAEVPGEFQAALVVADDAQGGWTNRFATEYKVRFDAGPHRNRFWISGVLWSSEAATERSVRETMLTAFYRTVHILGHGPARNLRAMLAQEGYAMRMAGCTGPSLDADDVAYTREVLLPYLEAEDMRTAIECLFGDEAGRILGFSPRGLSRWAGLALALHDAQCSAKPEPRSSGSQASSVRAR
jgi:hypothetical protein